MFAFEGFVSGLAGWRILPDETGLFSGSFQELQKVVWFKAALSVFCSNPEHETLGFEQLPVQVDK